MEPKTLEVVERVARNLYNYYSKEYSDPTLEGYCAILSAKLHKRLARYDVSSSFLYHSNEWGGHVFLRVEDSFVDVTARQFDTDLPPVVIKHIEDHNDHYWWKDVMEVSTLRELLKVQQQDGWPDSQWVPLL